MHVFVSRHRDDGGPPRWALSGARPIVRRTAGQTYEDIYERPGDPWLMLKFLCADFIKSAFAADTETADAVLALQPLDSMRIQLWLSRDVTRRVKL